MTKLRKTALTITIALLFMVGIATSTYLYMTGFDLRIFLDSFQMNTYEKAGVMLALYTLRNYLFIPSTVIIVLTGVVLQNFLLTAVVSIIGVSIGIAETYAIGYLFREDMAEKKSFRLIEKYRKSLDENGVKIVFFSCMFPLTPVDLVYYAAGFVRYSFVPFFFAALVGEMWLILLYAYLWSEAHKYASYFGYFLAIFLLGYALWWLWKKRKNSQRISENQN